MKKLLPLFVACCLPTGILASPLVDTWQADATALLTPGCADFCPEQVAMTATFSERTEDDVTAVARAAWGDAKAHR